MTWRIWCLSKCLCTPLQSDQSRCDSVANAIEITATALIIEMHANAPHRSPVNLLWQWEYRADSRLVPSQWETSLQSNAVSHWLGANLESALDYYDKFVAVELHCRTFQSISWSSATILHSHVTPLRQMFTSVGCRAILLQSHCNLWPLFQDFCRSTFWNPVCLGSYRHQRSHFREM